MKIEIHPPLAVHESGQREYNEDCIYPPIHTMDVEAANPLFLVCDGVGGSAKGEEASHLACTIFAKHLKNKIWVDEVALTEALQLTQQAIDDYMALHPEAQGMATTLTVLSLHHKGATIAHMGDSRVYQIRQGKTIFKTTDHSFVQELIANKIITEEQAINHPKRHVVTRAIAGTQRPASLDVDYLTDVQADDYFFLCTDGILEGILEMDLQHLIGEETESDTDKLKHIHAKCSQRSRDNYSAYLVHIKEVNHEPEKAALLPAKSASKKKTKRSARAIGALSTLLVASSLIAFYWVFNAKREPAPTMKEFGSANVEAPLDSTDNDLYSDTTQLPPAKTQDTTQVDSLLFRAPTPPEDATAQPAKKTQRTTQKTRNKNLKKNNKSSRLNDKQQHKPSGNTKITVDTLSSLKLTPLLLTPSDKAISVKIDSVTAKKPKKSKTKQSNN